MSLGVLKVSQHGSSQLARKKSLFALRIWGYDNVKSLRQSKARHAGALSTTPRDGDAYARIAAAKEWICA